MKTNSQPKFLYWEPVIINTFELNWPLHFYTWETGTVVDCSFCDWEYCYDVVLDNNVEENGNSVFCVPEQYLELEPEEYEPCEEEECICDECLAKLTDEQLDKVETALDEEDDLLKDISKAYTRAIADADEEECYYKTAMRFMEHFAKLTNIG